MITYFSKTMKILTDAVLSMDLETFEKLTDECVKSLDNGGKVIVSGLGKNVPICEKIVGTMLSLGQNANFMHTNTAVHGDLGMVKPNDIVILLSKSGRTAETVYLADKLLERHSNIWLFTFDKTAPLSKRLSGTLAIDLAHEGDQWNLVPNNSSTVNMIVLQGLALEIAKRRNVTLEDFKANHPGGFIGEFLKNV